MLPRTIPRPCYYNYEHFVQLAAHEFGHLVGLGDAYKEPPKQFAAPKSTEETPEEFIMRDNSPVVTSNDIEMVLEAFRTNSLQTYDPEGILYPLSKVIRLQ